MHDADSLRIAQIVLAAPVWVRLGIGVPDARCRERAAETLAAIVMDKLARQEPETDERQLILPIP